MTHTLSVPIRSTGATATRTMPATVFSYVQYKNLQFNVIIIGWLGVIISVALLMTTLVAIRIQPELEMLLKDIFFKDITPTQQQFLKNMLTVFSSMVYALSLFNTVVSLLLLIGIARNMNSLLYPWLLFHGILFGVSLYLAIFYAAAGLFVDLSTFVLCLLTFGLIMVVFYKTYHEVFSLFKIMETQTQIASLSVPDPEQAWNALPCPALFLPVKQQ